MLQSDLMCEKQHISLLATMQEWVGWVVKSVSYLKCVVTGKADCLMLSRRLHLSLPRTFYTSLIHKAYKDWLWNWKLRVFSPFYFLCVHLSHYSWREDLLISLFQCKNLMWECVHCFTFSFQGWCGCRIWWHNSSFHYFPCYWCASCNIEFWGQNANRPQESSYEKKNVNLIGLMSNCLAAHYVTAAFF